jgi:hypothetical protein
MAIVFITEFADLPNVPGTMDSEVMPVGMFDGNAVVQAPITLTTASQNSAVFGAATRFIRVNSSGACNFLIGTSGTVTASTASVRLSADRTEYFGVAPGQVFACISGS